MSAPAGATTAGVATGIDPGETVVVGLNSREEPITATAMMSDDARTFAITTANRYMLDGQVILGQRIYLRDRVTGDSLLVDPLADGSVPDRSQHTNAASISGNGRFVVFESRSRAFADARDRNGTYDVYLRDTVLGTTTLVSRTKRGAAGNAQSYVDRGSISYDGRFVVFSSLANDLVRRDETGMDAFLFDARDRSVTAISRLPDGRTVGGSYPVIASDGKSVAFGSGSSEWVEGDANGKYDVFLRDLDTGAVELLSRGADGQAANDTSVTTALAGSGEVVLFESAATDLVEAPDVPATRDIFAFDRRTGATTLVSRDITGAATGGMEYAQADLSGDGSLVAYHSEADDVVPGDTNGQDDIFGFDLRDKSTTLVSKRPDGGFPDGHSYYPDVSADGRFVAFKTYARDIVEGGYANVVLHRLK